MLPNGHIVGGYRIENLIGRGGMGAVYEATQLSLKRTVALKILSDDVSSDAVFRERFRREGIVQATLEHPNIVPIYEAGGSDSELFLAMRLVRGKNLKQLIVLKELDSDRVLSIASQVAAALDAAHRGGLIHRDIKPQNILVEEEHAFLADFGLTKATGELGLTRTGLQPGTLDYMSPEQFKNRPATRMSDIYALGAVLYECVSGVVPFPRDSEAAVMYAHLEEPLPPLTRHRADLPTTVDEVMARAMAKDPANRPATAAELVATLDQALRGGEVPEQERVAAPTGERSSRKRVADTIVDRPLPTSRREQSKAQTRRTNPAKLILVGGTALAATALAGFAGLAVGRSQAKASLVGSKVASRGALAFSYPATWHVAHGLSLVGFHFGEPIAVAGRSGAGVIAGSIDAGAPSFVPKTLNRVLAVPPPKPSAVGVGGVEGYRVSPLHLKHSTRALALYVFPTTKGTVAAACFGPAEAGSKLAAECASIIGTIRLRGAKPLGVAPSETYAQRVRSAFARLAGQRSEGRASLAKAGKSAAQAQAAARVASAYRRAAGSLQKTATGPRDASANRAIVVALRAAANAYTSLSNAAKTEDSTAYAQAARLATHTEKHVETSLLGLKALGYAVASHA